MSHTVFAPRSYENSSGGEPLKRSPGINPNRDYTTEVKELVDGNIPPEAWEEDEPKIELQGQKKFVSVEDVPDERFSALELLLQKKDSQPEPVETEMDRYIRMAEDSHYANEQEDFVEERKRGYGEDFGEGKLKGAFADAQGVALIKDYGEPEVSLTQLEEAVKEELDTNGIHSADTEGFGRYPNAKKVNAITEERRLAHGDIHGPKMPFDRREPTRRWEKLKEVPRSKRYEASREEDLSSAEEQKEEYELSFGDRIQARGIEGVTFEEVLPQTSGSRIDMDSAQKRFEVLQSNEILSIRNKEGKELREILQEYFSLIEDFVMRHREIIEKYSLLSQSRSPEEFLKERVLLLVDWYGRIYNGNETFEHARNNEEFKNLYKSHVLRYLKDGLAKIMEFEPKSLRDTHRIPEAHDEAENYFFDLFDFRDKLYRLIESIPYSPKDSREAA